MFLCVIGKQRWSSLTSWEWFLRSLCYETCPHMTFIQIIQAQGHVSMLKCNLNHYHWAAQLWSLRKPYEALLSVVWSWAMVRASRNLVFWLHLTLMGLSCSPGVWTLELRNSSAGNSSISCNPSSCRLVWDTPQNWGTTLDAESKWWRCCHGDKKNHCHLGERGTVLF